MSDTARDYQTLITATTEGLEDLFEPEVVAATQVLPKQGLPSDHQGLAVEEAANALGVSARTVIKRLRKGTLAGFKVQDKFGDKWVVSPEAISGAPLVEVEQGPGAPHHSHEDGPGPTHVGPGEHHDLSMQRLLDIVERQSKELQAAHWRNGHLETRVADLEEQTRIQNDHIKLLTDSQHKTGWWVRFTKWCTHQ